MRSAPLETGSQLVRRLLLRTGLFVLAAVVLTSVYLTGLLRLGEGQWTGFAQIVAGALALIFPAMLAVHWRIFQRIRTCLDRRAAGTADPELLRSGFAALSDFPRYWFTWGLLWWTLGGLLVGAGMWLRYPDFGPLSVAIVVAATVSAALVTDMYYYFWAKRSLEPARLALAADLGAPAERGALVRRVSVRAKLLLATTSMILVTVVYAAFLSHARTEQATERVAGASQARFLEAVVASDHWTPARARAEAHRYGIADALWVLDSRAEGTLWGPRRGLGPAQLAAIRAAPDAGIGAAGDLCFAWRRAPGDGRILVSASSRGTIRGAAARSVGDFALLVVLSTLVAVGAAGLLSLDVGRATAALRARAERVAAGDLSGGRPFESEDDLGELARAFEGMEASLAATVGRVAGAADRMQEAAGQIAQAAESVTRVSADQVRGIDHATSAMGEIDREVHGISRSAEGLSESMHEVTSAVFELDATGGELSESAGALSGHVGDVTASIEQLARSIGHVAQNADGLARASDDASASMEQTTQTVREMDANAAEMARLVGQVVDLSASGHEQVQQTIRGMHEIHHASESAAAVIQELGESTEAIGAILGVIDDIADETNLLALNAAIIAAQAGEHGRGFAVVADEIKSLADRVLESTKEISSLIHSVQNGAREATAAMATGSERVRRGVELAGEAGVALEAITGATRESGNRVGEIVHAVREQAGAMGHVAQMMGQVRMGGEEIRQAIWEQGRATGVLRSSSQEMDDVSRRVHNTTEEQVRSFGHIRGSVDSIREAVERIDEALRGQSAACRNAVESAQQVATRTHSNEESVRRLEEAMGDLLRQAEELRNEIRGFAI